MPRPSKEPAVLVRPTHEQSGASKIEVVFPPRVQATQSGLWFHPRGLIRRCAISRLQLLGWSLTRCQKMRRAKRHPQRNIFFATKISVIATIGGVAHNVAAFRATIDRPRSEERAVYFASFRIP
jgi:hypothetical protein